MCERKAEGGPVRRGGGDREGNMGEGDGGGRWEREVGRERWGGGVRGESISTVNV